MHSKTEMQNPILFDTRKKVAASIVDLFLSCEKFCDECPVWKSIPLCASMY